MQVVPHITDEIKQRIRLIAETSDVDVVITEIGGTVGDIESLPFLEAIRQFPVDVGRRDCMFIHLTLVPYIGHAGELKTKPTQHSVNELRRIGIQPDMLLCRSESPSSSTDIRKKIALFASLPRRRRRLGQGRRQHLQGAALVRRRRASTTSSSTTSASTRPAGRPARVGDITAPRRRGRPSRCGSRSSASTSQLEDAYLSVAEALRHCGFHARRAHRDRLGRLRDAHDRRGRARAAGRRRRHPRPRRLRRPRHRGQDPRRPQVAREQRIPYLGHLPRACRSPSASSPATSPAWRARTRPSSTSRPSGRSSTCCPSRRRSPTSAARCAWAPTRSSSTPDTRARELYGEAVIYERHRHRYEVSISLRKRLEAAGLVVSRHVARRAPRRDHRAARPPVLRRLAVPPRVQVAPGAPGAAVPRLRRGRARARAQARRPEGEPAVHAAQRDRARADAPGRAARLRGRAPAAQRARSPSCARSPARSGASAPCADRVAARAAARSASRSSEDGAAAEAGARARQPARAHPRPRASARSCSARTSTPCPHDGIDRAGPRRRRLGERGRHDPRRRQQGRRRRDARGSRGARAIEGSPVGLELLFTVSEENALGRRQGVRRRRRCAARFGYVFDHATPIGEIVVASPTYYRLEAALPRRARRTPGIRPEDGRSAIVAAARAIAAMRARAHRRRDDRERRLDPRRRRRDEHRARRAARSSARCARWTTRRSRRSWPRSSTAARRGATTPACECDVDVTVERLFAGYRHRARRARRCSPPRRRCAPAATRRGAIVTGGGSDANAFEAAGFPCTNLANGTERNHEPTERVSVAALEGMLDVTLRAARRMLAPERAACDACVVAEAARRPAPSSALVDRRRRAAAARRSPTSALVGAAQPGDEVVVNIAGVELGARLGRLRRRPREPHARPRRRRATPGAHVMKLNYTCCSTRSCPSRRAPELAAVPAAARPAARRLGCTASSRRSPGRSRRRRRRRAARLRPDRRRRAARRALARRARPARARPARRPPHRRAGVRRRRGRGDHDRRRDAPRARASSAGTPRSCGPGPGHPRLGLGARPRRHGGAGHRARGARARLPGAARARGCRRPTARRATAGSATTRARCSSCCWRRSPSRCRRGRATASRGDARHDGARAADADLDGYAAPAACRALDGPRRRGPALLRRGARRRRGAGAKIATP